MSPRDDRPTAAQRPPLWGATALRDALERRDLAALRALFADDIMCHEVARDGHTRSTRDCAAALAALLALDDGADGTTVSMAGAVLAGPYATFLLEWPAPPSGAHAPVGGHCALIAHLNDSGALREVWAIELVSEPHDAGRRHDNG